MRKMTVEFIQGRTGQDDKSIKLVQPYLSKPVTFKKVGDTKVLPYEEARQLIEENPKSFRRVLEHWEEEPVPEKGEDPAKSVKDQIGPVNPPMDDVDQKKADKEVLVHYANERFKDLPGYPGLEEFMAHEALLTDIALYEEKLQEEIAE